MEATTTITGKTQKELKSIYLSAIETLVDFGATEKEARKIVKQTFKESVGL